jgi:phosphotriesterase-related protein
MFYLSRKEDREISQEKRPVLPPGGHHGMAVKRHAGKVITALGPVEPSALGRVMMHEHLYCDTYDWERGELVQEERPISEERRALLMREAIPFLRQCTEYGCFAYVETTMPPWRAWPTFYAEASRAAGMHIVLCTGFYREVEVGTYWVKTCDEAIWPFVRRASVTELAEFCTREITEGIHGARVCAGAIKLGSSGPELTEAEEKVFRAGARAQQATGVHVTTHCTALGAETSQLRVLDDEGVDLGRVVIGHTAAHLMDRERRKTVMEWMRRGASFMPTNLAVGEHPEKWQPLIDAIHAVFDAGLGDRLVIGTDWAFVSESAPFGPCSYLPPPPYVQLFTNVLPAFHELGLTAEEEEQMMATNPQRLLPVQ